MIRFDLIKSNHLQESVMMTVACEPFDFASEDTNNDRISFEWTNAPEGAAKQFRREWFQVQLSKSNHIIESLNRTSLNHCF